MDMFRAYTKIQSWLWHIYYSVYCLTIEANGDAPVVTTVVNTQHCCFFATYPEIRRQVTVAILFQMWIFWLRSMSRLIASPRQWLHNQNTPAFWTHCVCICENLSSSPIFFLVCLDIVRCLIGKRWKMCQICISDCWLDSITIRLLTGEVAARLPLKLISLFVSCRVCSRKERTRQALFSPEVSQRCPMKLSYFYWRTFASGA